MSTVMSDRVRDVAGHIVHDPATGVAKKRKIPSYWMKPVGIDRGEPSAWRYAFHMLIGHHGIFSLTPIFLASLVGAFDVGFCRKRRSQAVPGVVDRRDLGCLHRVLLMRNGRP